MRKWQSCFFSVFRVFSSFFGEHAFLQKRLMSISVKNRGVTGGESVTTRIIRGVSFDWADSAPELESVGWPVTWNFQVETFSYWNRLRNKLRNRLRLVGSDLISWVRRAASDMIDWLNYVTDLLLHGEVRIRWSWLFRLFWCATDAALTGSFLGLHSNGEEISTWIGVVNEMAERKLDDEETRREQRYVMAQPALIKNFTRTV